MQKADSASVGAVQAYVARTSAMRIPESEIRATRRFDSDGRFVGNPPPSEARNTIVRQQRTPRWETVACPSLAIYAIPAPPESWLPYYDTLDSSEREHADDYFEAYAGWTAENRDRFGQLPQNQVLEFPSSNHYFFLEKPEETAEAISRFIFNLR